MKKIIFSGDSFTWGESIELENDNYLKLLESGDVMFDKKRMPYMGYNHAHFHDIASNVDSIEHRTKYRFPTLVSKHFNAIGYIKEMNGGANEPNLDSLTNFVISVIGCSIFLINHDVVLSIKITISRYISNSILEFIFSEIFLII